MAITLNLKSFLMQNKIFIINIKITKILQFTSGTKQIIMLLDKTAKPKKYAFNMSSGLSFHTQLKKN